MIIFHGIMAGILLGVAAFVWHISKKLSKLYGDVYRFLDSTWKCFSFDQHKLNRQLEEYMERNHKDIMLWDQMQKSLQEKYISMEKDISETKRLVNLVSKAVVNEVPKV